LKKYYKKGRRRMTVTREELIRRLSEKSNYYMQDVRHLLRCLDKVVLECFNEVTDEEGVSVQLLSGVKIGCDIMPERQRKDPRTQEDIICAPCCKPNAKFSQDFRKSIQQQYETKKNG
jgi:nucleoid DNA-binding protein